MELIVALVVGVLVAGGVWLCLREHLYSVLLGLTLLSYAVNLLLLASGRLLHGSAPLVADGRIAYPDPLPQALILTAIVIGLAMTALVAALAVRGHALEGTEHVDGRDDDAPPAAQRVP